MIDQEHFDIGELRRLADIGGSALKQGMPKEAESICSAILPFCPPNSNGPLIGLAMAKFGQSKIDEAIELLRDKALVNNPNCADSAAHLALILRTTGQIEESEFYLQSALEQTVDNGLTELLDKIENNTFDAKISNYSEE